MKKIQLLSLLFAIAVTVQAQEFKARVTVVTTRVGNNVNRNTFTTLQTALNNFLNNRKWTTDKFENNEKLECNFFVESGKHR